MPLVPLSLLVVFVTTKGFRIRKDPVTLPAGAPLRFLMIGDQGTLDDNQKAVAYGLAKVANETDPAAILGIGDNIYCCGAEGSPEKIQQYWSDIYLKHSSLKRPWYMVTGNHDWLSDASVERDFTDDRRNKKGWWHMPHFWYSQSTSSSGMTVDTFHIDTQIWLGGFNLRWLLGVENVSKLQDEQVEWLQGALSKSNAEWKVVIGHHPVYSAGMHGMSKQLHRTLDPILRQQGVPIYIAAHDHTQQLIQYRGLNYIISGAGGKHARFGSNGYPENSLRHNLRYNGFAGLEFHNRSLATLTYYDKNGIEIVTESVQNEAPAFNTVPDSCTPEAVRRRRASGADMCSCRRRWSSPVVKYLKDGLVCDGYVIGKKIDFEEAEIKDTPKPTCGGVVLQDVDLYCPSATDDNCTVSANKPKNSTCEDYCAMHGLTCAGGWEQEEENCMKKTSVGCNHTTVSVNNHICQCAPKLISRLGGGLGRGWSRVKGSLSFLRGRLSDELEGVLDPE